MATIRKRKSSKSQKKSSVKEDIIPVTEKAEIEPHFRKYVLPKGHILLSKIQKKDSGCVFITGLPFGMTERNLRLYMQQFGEVMRCRVHTCPKTGRTRGYGYVHFRLSEVARIAAQTMNNHLITGSVLKCRLIPGRFVKESFFSMGDRGYHRRIKKNIDKLNNTKRSDLREKKLLKKRQALARKQIEKLSRSEINCNDLGIKEPAAESNEKKTALVKNTTLKPRGTQRTLKESEVPARRSLVLIKKNSPAKSTVKIVKKKTKK
ncbi:MKI67 FHA domain-interacting nucleolar phosphoprotein-like [Hyalella azteca]|uniref:MKI67 FHA domain-interacting nucleolar phosphoprotein-like n=1 Tax=Hyalella azteca TaxID=294128 RepID=A0A8B7P5B8_HYAAZ|nr:MKI67 FHA domain-interacting nucleolar phosphoprotein-like [Hyalella azteca]